MTRSLFSPSNLLPTTLSVIILAVPGYAVADDDDERQPPIEDLFKTELVFPQATG